MNEETKPPNPELNQTSKVILILFLLVVGFFVVKWVMDKNEETRKASYSEMMDAIRH